MNIWELVLSALVLVLVVSIDLFACGLCYGVERTRVPLAHLLVINVVGSLLIAVALVVGYIVGQTIPERVAGFITFGVFFLLGLYKFVCWLAGRRARQREGEDDQDHRTISIRQTFVLAVILALDGMFVAFGASMEIPNLVFIGAVVLMSLVANVLIFRAGWHIGARLVRRRKYDLGWLGALALWAIAVVQVFL